MIQGFIPHPLALILVFTIGALGFCYMVYKNRKEKAFDNTAFIYPVALMCGALIVILYQINVGLLTMDSFNESIRQILHNT